MPKVSLPLCASAVFSWRLFSVPNTDGKRFQSSKCRRPTKPYFASSGRSQRVLEFRRARRGNKRNRLYIRTWVHCHMRAPYNKSIGFVHNSGILIQNEVRIYLLNIPNLREIKDHAMEHSLIMVFYLLKTPTKRYNHHQGFYKTIRLPIHINGPTETNLVSVYSLPFFSEGDKDVCEHLYQGRHCSLEDVIRNKINKSPYRSCRVKGNG